MNNYWCEICDNRWAEEYALECPKCHSRHDFRRTMTEEQARELNLLKTKELENEQI